MTDCEELDENEYRRLHSLMAYERRAYQKGYNYVGGIDEAGRGPLAGPVVAAVCILPKTKKIPRVDDSKKLEAKLRTQIFDKLVNDSDIYYGIGIIEAEEIDRINIYQATIQAMLQAVQQLKVVPDYLLVDGLALPHPTIPSEKIIKGDQLSQSIAAASILAKETRDRIMLKHHKQWPEYGFDRHKGYATTKHREALGQHGPCPIHRSSFKWQKASDERNVNIYV